MSAGMRVLRALTRNRARTSPVEADRRLRGITCAIPFERVWQSALALAKRRRGWRVLEADDVQGRIRAEARTLLRFTHDVEIDVTLDGNGQTRLDLISASRVGKADFGKNARRIARFLRALRKELGKRPRAKPEARPRALKEA